MRRVGDAISVSSSSLLPPERATESFRDRSRNVPAVPASAGAKIELQVQQVLCYISDTLPRRAGRPGLLPGAAFFVAGGFPPPRTFDHAPAGAVAGYAPNEEEGSVPRSCAVRSNEWLPSLETVRWRVDRRREKTRPNRDLDGLLRLLDRRIPAMSHVRCHRKCHNLV